MEKKMIRKSVWGSRKPAPVDVASILNQPAGKQMSPAAVTSCAEHALAGSNGSASTGAPSALAGEWITTAVAAKLTGYSRRQIHFLCDSGFFIEGREWKQRPPCPGYRAGGRIRIKRSALDKLENGISPQSTA